MSPQCNPQSAQGPPGLQPASIRNAPCVKCKLASGIRTWNCADPGKASNLVPEAREGGVLRNLLWRFRIRRRIV
eukprot:14285435-Alexandrium_andersonii.AAC.1